MVSPEFRLRPRCAMGGDGAQSHMRATSSRGLGADRGGVEGGGGEVGVAEHRGDGG